MEKIAEEVGLAPSSLKPTQPAQGNLEICSGHRGLWPVSAFSSMQGPLGCSLPHPKSNAAPFSCPDNEGWPLVIPHPPTQGPCQTVSCSKMQPSLAHWAFPEGAGPVPLGPCGSEWVLEPEVETDAEGEHKPHPPALSPPRFPCCRGGQRGGGQV